MKMNRDDTRIFQLTDYDMYDTVWSAAGLGDDDDNAGEDDGINDDDGDDV